MAVPKNQRVHTHAVLKTLYQNLEPQGRNERQRQQRFHSKELYDIDGTLVFC